MDCPDFFWCVFADTTLCDDIFFIKKQLFISSEKSQTHVSKQFDLHRDLAANRPFVPKNCNVYKILNRSFSSDFSNTWPERKTVKVNTAVASWQLQFFESESDGMQTRNLLMSLFFSESCGSAYFRFHGGFERSLSICLLLNFCRRLNTTTIKKNEILNKNKKRHTHCPPPPKCEWFEKAVAWFEIVLKIIQSKGNTRTFQGTFSWNQTSVSTCNKMPSFALKEREV